MILNEPTKVFPEDDDPEINKTHFFLEETKVRKKKRRFILYFLIILITFIIVRVLLIAITLYKLYSSLDVDKLFLKSMKYDSTNPDSLFLDIQIGEVSSPLFVRIKDIECNVYGNDGVDHLFGLNIPDIEIVKYKTVSFKNDISLKDIDSNIIDKWSKTKTITVKSRGKLYYRICLMILHINWEKERVIKVRDDDNKLRFPKINEVKLKNVEDTISMAFTVDHNSVHLPPYMDITLSKTELRFGEDLPCSIIISQLVAKNGIIKSPFIVTVEVKKEDYEKIIQTAMKLVQNETIYFEIKELIMEVKDKLKKRHYMNLIGNIKGNSGTSGGASDWKPGIAVLEDIRAEHNSIMCNIKIDPKFLSIIDRDTKLIFQGVEVHSEVRMFSKPISNITMFISSEKSYINLAVAVTFIDLQTALDYLRNGHIDFTFELGDERKKYSFLRGLLIYYNPNRKGLAIRYNEFYRTNLFEKSTTKETQTNNDTNVLKDVVASDASTQANKARIVSRKGMSHYISSCNEDIRIQSKIYDGRMIGSPEGIAMLLIKIPRVKFHISHEFFSGDLILSKSYSSYVYGIGFVADIKTELSLKPKMDKIGNFRNLNDLFKTDFTLEIANSTLRYRFVNQTQEDDQTIPILLKNLDINYKECEDFKKHVITVKGPKEYFPKILRNNSFKISENLLGLGIYTKGVPLNDPKPNITLNETLFDFKDNDVVDAFKADLNIYIGSLDLLKSMMYGEFYFYSTKNTFSYVIAQYLNNLMNQKSSSNMKKKIVDGECKFDLQIDGTVSNRDEPGTYGGKLELSLPTRVIESFKLKPFKIPKISFEFLSGGNKSASFDLETECRAGTTNSPISLLVLEFKIDPMIFTASNQEFVWKTTTNNITTAKKYSNTPEPLLKFLRMFFVKVFELPKDDQTKPDTTKIGLAIAHDEIKVVDSMRHTLNTKACVVLYADPMDVFFIKSIPEILLKCGFSILPNVFKMEMRSNRLELLNLYLEPFGDYKAHAENVKCCETFRLEYPPEIEIEHSELAENESKGESHLAKLIPRDIYNSRGKLTFYGDVSLSCLQENKMVVSGARVEFPFPIFLATIMKVPSNDPLNVFIRFSLLDLAIAMPFSLSIYAREKIRYKLLYNELLILNDEVVVDQSLDRFFHFPIRSIDHSSLGLIIKNILNGAYLPFTLTFLQGNRTLMMSDISLANSVYSDLEYFLGTQLANLSQSFKINRIPILQSLGLYENYNA